MPVDTYTVKDGYVGQHRKLSFRVTPWHIKRLNELRSKGLSDKGVPRSVSAVMREALEALWKRECVDEGEVKGQASDD